MKILRFYSDFKKLLKFRDTIGTSFLQLNLNMMYLCDPIWTWLLHVNVFQKISEQEIDFLRLSHF